MSKDYREYDDTPIRRQIKDKEAELFQLYMQESKESGEQSPVSYTILIKGEEVKLSVDTRRPHEICVGSSFHLETDTYHVMHDNFYGYEQAVFEDCITYFLENLTAEEWDTLAEEGELDAKHIADAYRDEMFEGDAITGNASGSYFCSTAKAQWALLGNIDILTEAEDNLDTHHTDPEKQDVLIRCYLLDQCIEPAILRIHQAIKGALTEDITHNEI